MRVAIVHYWLVGMRGGERVLEALCRMFPGADLYTHVVVPENLSETLLRHRIQTTFIGRLPAARRAYTRYLPLMPMALERIDLQAYDLVISSEAGPAKGIIPAPGAIHLTYCHSPMRYVWDQYHVYRAGAGALTRMLMGPISHYLRIWDVTSATRVDGFVANSAHVASRIRKYYRREADVVHPPVALDDFAPVASEMRGDFYLWCGELVAYKRPEIAVAAFNESGRPLVVIGDGAERRQLARIAKPNIRFLGKTDFGVLREHMGRCRALIFPGEEDFGLVPLEVQASGRPVIALAKGGALETVIDGETGLFYEDATTAGLNAAITRFEASGLGERCGPSCRRNAERFSEDRFREGIARALDQLGVRVAP